MNSRQLSISPSIIISIDQRQVGTRHVQHDRNRRMRSVTRTPPHLLNLAGLGRSWGILIDCKDYSSLVGSPAHGRNGAGRSCHDRDAETDYFIEAISKGHL